MPCLRKSICNRQECQKILFGKMSSQSQQSNSKKEHPEGIFLCVVWRNLYVYAQKKILFKGLPSLCKRQINQKEEKLRQSSFTYSGAGGYLKPGGRLKLRSVRTEVSTKLGGAGCRFMPYVRSFYTKRRIASAASSKQ